MIRNASLKTWLKGFDHISVGFEKLEDGDVFHNDSCHVLLMTTLRCFSGHMLELSSGSIVFGESWKTEGYIYLICCQTLY
jgi:hypothetical protein